MAVINLKGVSALNITGVSGLSISGGVASLSILAPTGPVQFVDGTVVGTTGNTPGISLGPHQTGFARTGTTSDQKLYTILDGFMVMVQDVAFGCTITATQALGFSAGVDTARDVSLSRGAAGVLNLGAGGYGAIDGTLRLGHLEIVNGGNPSLFILNSGNYSIILDYTSGIHIYSGGLINFSAASTATGLDAGISRLAANTIALGNGTASDETATVRAAIFDAGANFFLTHGTGLYASPGRVILPTTNGTGYSFSAGADASAGADTNLSRLSAAVIALGNGTAFDFSGTLKLAHITVVSLVSFASNAAAITGGLTAGDMYTVTGTDPLQTAVVF